MKNISRSYAAQNKLQPPPFVWKSIHYQTFFVIFSGVPQGIHLRPILFLLFINDIFSSYSKILLHSNDFQKSIEIIWKRFLLLVFRHFRFKYPSNTSLIKLKNLLSVMNRQKYVIILVKLLNRINRNSFTLYPAIQIARTIISKIK